MEVKLNIPEGWDQVTIEQFMKLPPENLIENLSETISVLTGQDKSVIDGLSSDSVNEVVNHIGWILLLPREDYYKKEVSIEGGTVYLKQTSDYTLKDWTDLIFYAKDHRKNLAQMFSIIYMKEDGKRVPLDEIMRANIGDVYGALVFFSTIENQYLKNLPFYLGKQARETMKKMSKTEKLRRHFHGMRWPTILRRGT